MWPPVLRNVNPGKIIAIRIRINKLKQIIESLGMHITDFEEFDLIICDYYFMIDSDQYQTFLFPENFSLKQHIESEKIRLRVVSEDIITSYYNTFN
ncbi:MAG: hypothetical protein LBK13_08395 [Spirochaetales bacterium]|nr:hypothetical protein [Spirochaetales bacterium]